VTRGRRPIRKFRLEIPNEKTRADFLRAGLMIFAMMTLCQ
jgi:hypothetical protein